MVPSMFRGEMEQADDLRLLRRYAADGCARAFETVVRRHIAWVYSSSLRQVGDPHLAEDVTQAVFVLLARRAAKLHDDTLVTGWLFNTLRFTAREARRKEARRRRHESAAALAPETPAPEGIDRESWEAMAPLLDQAVASLKESDRQAVLLRFYEGRDFADIARILGVAEPAARKRVSRAVERLGRFFKRRGITRPTALVLALLLLLTRSSADAAPLVPAILTTATGPAPLAPPAARLRRRVGRSPHPATRRQLLATLAAGIALLALLTTLVAWLADVPPPIDPRDFATPTPVDPWPNTTSQARLSDRLDLPAPPESRRPVAEVTPAAAPARDRPAHPLAGIDAAWWVRQWYDPAGGPATPQARKNSPAGDDAIDPATGQPRPAPGTNPQDYVESYAQMGGGGGGSAPAATPRPLGPVAGEVNGATASPRGASAASASSDAATASRIAAVVQTIVADSSDPAPDSPTVSGRLTPVTLRDTHLTFVMADSAAAVTGQWGLVSFHPAGSSLGVFRRYISADGTVNLVLEGLVASDLDNLLVPASVFLSPDATNAPFVVVGPVDPPTPQTVPVAYVQAPEPATPLLLLAALALPRPARHRRRR